MIRICFLQVFRDRYARYCCVGKRVCAKGCKAGRQRDRLERGAVPKGIRIDFSQCSREGYFGDRLISAKRRGSDRKNVIPVQFRGNRQFSICRFSGITGDLYTAADVLIGKVPIPGFSSLVGRALLYIFEDLRLFLIIGRLRIAILCVIRTYNFVGLRSVFVVRRRISGV